MRLRRIEPLLRRALRGPCRMPRGATLLAAVSGGADSTALLTALHSVAPEFGLKLAAAHLHHGLRADDADADREHVRALCERLGVPLLDARWDCRARMRRRALSGEAGLRTLRREFLVSASRRTGATAIATAHTADDQLETMLLRLARGTGVAGLAGMLPRRGIWLKPLLQVTRCDIERDLLRARIAWREDSSNATRAYARNRVRHDVVPALLDALGTPAGPAVSRRAGLARRAVAAAAETAGAARMLARIATRALAAAALPGSGSHALDPAKVAPYPASVRRAMVRRLWQRANPASDGLARSQLEPVLALLGERTAAGSVDLPGGWKAARTSKRFSFLPPSGAPRLERR